MTAIEDKPNMLLTEMSIFVFMIVYEKVDYPIYPVNVLLKAHNLISISQPLLVYIYIYFGKTQGIVACRYRLTHFPVYGRKYGGGGAIDCLNSKIFSQKVSIVMQQKSYQMRCPCIATCNNHFMNKSVV